jgi:hypothetical protein
MASVCINRRQFDRVEWHYQRCLDLSKRFRVEGEAKITDLFSALKTLGGLREHQGDVIRTVLTPYASK